MPVSDPDQLDAYRAMVPDVNGIDFDTHRAVSEEMGRLIEEHASSHRNSNSPYGHSCPSSCLASSILLWQARRVEQIMTEDGTEDQHA